MFLQWIIISSASSKYCDEITKFRYAYFYLFTRELLYIPVILILTEPRPLHCFTCAKEMMFESVPFCNWIVNYEMSRAVALHIYLHWDDSCTAIFNLSTLFSLYDSLWLTKWLEIVLFMMTSSNGNIFRVTGPLCHRWISPKKASDAKLWWFHWSALEQPLCNNPNAGDLKRYRAHYDVTVIYRSLPKQFLTIATIIKQPVSRLFNRHE